MRYQRAALRKPIERTRRHRLCRGPENLRRLPGDKSNLPDNRRGGAAQARPRRSRPTCPCCGRALQPETERAQEALDLFRLSFYLRGINGVDIAQAGPDLIYNGRLLYDRAKTGKAYSVKLEPEALEVIGRRGDRLHLFAPMAKFADYGRYIQDVNEKLRALALGNGLPPVTMYWARHTFASLVIETGGTMEILAGALGHSYGPRITAGYVTLQQRQVDEAVRRVFDFVK